MKKASSRHEDLMNKRFGRLVVIAESKKRTANRGMVWRCLCDCGVEKDIAALALKNGSIVSCGCYNREVNRKKNTKHGHETGRKSITYVSWEKMMSRCFRENDSSYCRYGAKGITVCQEWRDFANFLADMGERPTKRHTIDRIDGKGNYEPNNCRWATYKQQGNNTSRNKRFEYRGEFKTISELADISGIKYDTMYNRLVIYGWSIENAMKVDVSKSNCKKGY